MAMDNLKDSGFGKSDAQLAKTFGMSMSEFQKAKKKIIAEATKSKPTVKPVSPKTKPAMPKSKSPATLTGEKAAEALKKRTSPKGVKEFEKRAGKALDKKYPGLYKKSK